MRPIRPVLAVIALFLASRTPLAAQQAKRAFSLSDWYKLTTLSSPAMSPDGSRIAFQVQTVNEKDDKYHREVWVVTAGSPGSPGSPQRGPGGWTDPQRFTSPSTESSNPRWSPDGKYLLFTSERPGGKGSTWMLRMDQPGGEAFQNENYPRGTSAPADGRFAVWSDADSVPPPDSARRADDPFAKMQPMARPPYGAITKPTDPARFDGRHIYDMRFKSNDQGYVPGAREVRKWNPAQIWVQAFDGTPKRKITDTRYSHRGASVSPDGQWVAFTADAHLRPDSVVQAERDSVARLPYDRKRDDVDRNDVNVYVMPIRGGAPRAVATLLSDASRIVWSPDSKRLAFIASPSRVKSDRVYVVNMSGGAPENILGDFTYEPNGIDWLKDGSIAMIAAIGGSTGIFHIDPATKAIKQTVTGRRRITGFSGDGRSKIAFVATDLTHPTELYVANSDGTGERKLTSFNDKLNNEIAWSDAERFTFKSVGGLEIESWLMKPYGYEAGKKYPLVLYIHGGPHSAYGENWFDEFQNLTAAGMFVLFTNPRGSSGYGADFTFSTRGRWGGEDYQDLMKAVDIASKRADVDSTRMGVTGGSYGGFMTAWVTTKTNRFKAAEADRMISDWTYWYGASDAQGLTEFEFYGKPWDNFAMYDTLSPIRGVQRVKTPTLIVQSEEDFRTPMGNAELWFIALKKQGVPVELVRYPRSTHELSRSGEPWLLVDRLGRLRQWFTYWLKDKPVSTAER
jgi:dipeptidyl aminopeptidase/acylaminoacyl peptidase